MLRKDPDQRPTAQQILDFPPIAKYVTKITEDERYQDDYLNNIGVKTKGFGNRTKQAMSRIEELQANENLQTEIDMRNMHRLRTIHEKY